MTVAEFFKDIEKQIKDKYWKMFFKTFILFFIFLITAVCFILYLMLNKITIEAPPNNPHLFEKLTGLLIFMAFLFSLIYTTSVNRQNVIRSLKIPENFKQINLYESFEYFTKKENPTLNDNEVAMIVEQLYEEYRLKELQYLTKITSNINEKNASDNEKEECNKQFLQKTKTLFSKSLIYKYY